MTISKAEKAALNAVLKGLGVYTEFEKGTGCLDYKGCSFGFNNEAQVDIDNKGQVTLLNYDTSDPSLKGKDSFLSTEIGNLSHLSTLGLVNFGLKQSIPTEIGNLKALRILNLGNNNLKGSIPSEISNMNSLVYLDLCVNQLSGLIPTEIGNMKALSILNLSNNNLSGSIPTEISNSKGLQILDLSTNCLSIDPDGVKVIKSSNVYNTGSVNFNKNCITIGDLKGVIQTNCDNCPSCKGNKIENISISGSKLNINYNHGICK